MNKNVRKMLVNEQRQNGMYGRERHTDGSRYGTDWYDGYSDGPRREHFSENRTPRDYSGALERRAEYRSRSERPLAGDGGFVPYESRQPKKLDRAMAEQWTAGMKNEDGTTGPHWNMEQVKQAMAQRGLSGDPVEYYAVLNSLYSDFGEVFRKYNLKMDFYCDLARAWLDDSDAVDNKAAAYFEYVVRH